MSLGFIKAYRKLSKDFTRRRKLSFCNTVVLIIQKSVKSLQVRLNEFVSCFACSSETISASALSQARLKLNPDALKELSEDVVRFAYQDGDYKTFHGYELLGVDGSSVYLPPSDSVHIHFGLQNSGSTQLYCTGQWMCIYDCLNRMLVASSLEKAVYEVDALHSLIKNQKLTTNPLLVMDRGFNSYDNMPQLNKLGMKFVIRLPKNSFKEAREMFADNQCHDRVVNISKNAKGGADSLNIRLIRIELSTGETELLATNVFEIGYEKFQELYNLRWQEETYFLLVKERLSLENFTGKSLIAVYQDFWSTVFLSNLESFLIEPAQDILSSRETKNPQKVNNAVAFGAIKDNALDLFNSGASTDDLLEKLTKLFLTNPVQCRKNRSRLRKKCPHRSLNHNKYRRKMVF